MLGHKMPITCLLLLDRNSLISGSSDRTIRVSISLIHNTQFCNPHATLCTISLYHLIVFSLVFSLLSVYILFPHFISSCLSSPCLSTIFPFFVTKILYPLVLNPPHIYLLDVGSFYRGMHARLNTTSGQYKGIN